MSGSTKSSSKLSLRQKVRSLVSSSSASPPRTNSSLPTKHNTVPPTTASSQSLTGSAVNPSSFSHQQPQRTSLPTTSSLLDEALQHIPQPDRAILQQNVCATSNDIYSTVDQALKSVRDKRQTCLDKRWKWTIGGQEIVLRDEADKLVGWLNRFKSVGDIASNADPIHAGLPWAGIRLLLEVGRLISTRLDTDLSLMTDCRCRIETNGLLAGWIGAGIVHGEPAQGICRLPI